MAAGEDGEPSWSPDGSRMLFDSTREGNEELYVMNAAGSGQTRLTYNPLRDCCATWSPDGTRVAYSADFEGQVEIYVMRTDASDSPGRNVTQDWSDDYCPSWAPW